MTMKQISFLPEPKYNPKYPTRTSLASKALRLMMNGRKVSHPIFEAYTGSWRLAAHIHVLKRLGWPIQRDNVSVELENTRQMGLYYLPDDLIDVMKGVAHE